MDGLIPALAIFGGGALLVWAGIEDPEGGLVSGLQGLTRGEPTTKRSSVVGAAFIQNAVAGLSLGSAGAGVQPAAATSSGTTATGTRGQVVAAAQSWLGVRYSFGGDTRSGVDCSGLTRAVFATVGVSLQRVSQLQALQGNRTTTPQPGDLVWFGIPVHHVGIYIGGSQIIHAPHPGTVVRVENIWNEPHGYRDLLGAATTSAAPPAAASSVQTAATRRPKRRKPGTVKA